MERTACFLDVEHMMDQIPFCSLNPLQMHRLRKKLRKSVRWLAEKEGVTRFLTCMDLGIGLCAAECVLEQKRKNPAIRLECILPYEEQCKGWQEQDRDRYFAVMAGCDREKLLCAEKTPDSLESAARYILNRSTFAVIHWLGNPREASVWVKRAIDLKKQVVVFDLDSI